MSSASRPEGPVPALALLGIIKRFGHVAALDGADLTVSSGTVHALLGENGAGKTTLMRIAFGMLRPDAGTLMVDGLARRFKSPAESIAAGVGMVHQHFALVPAMTVADNVALGLSGRYDHRAAAQQVRRIGAATGLELDPDALVSSLSVEAQQRLEIVKALARDVRLLILDEPTAVLPPTAAAELFQWLRQFAAGDRSVVLITHKLGEALAVADDLTVLRRGRTVLATAAAAATEATLAAAMLGTTDDRHQMPQTTDIGVGTARGIRRSSTAVLVAAHLRVTDDRGITVIADASFTIHGGEIVGIAAVEGEGQHELLRVLAGRRAVASGTLTAPAAVGFVPEDRQHDALVLDFPVYENVALREAGSRRGRMSWRHVRAETERMVAAFDVRVSSVQATASELSGGNQQKLVLARELDGRPAALVVENPTRGLDIGATAFVHHELRAARDAGTAVVVYASDVDEVLSLADRVLVVAQRTVREMPPSPDRAVVGRAMLGS